jgi:hypothetical protein
MLGGKSKHREQKRKALGQMCPRPQSASLTYSRECRSRYGAAARQVERNRRLPHHGDDAGRRRYIRAFLEDVWIKVRAQALFHRRGY